MRIVHNPRYAGAFVYGRTHTRKTEADRLHQQQVERARYEAELAQRRYLRVDSDNRLVADSLQADWL